MDFDYQKFNNALELYKKKDYIKSEVLFKDLLKTDNIDLRVYLYLGIINIRHYKNWDNSLKYLNMFNNKNSNNIDCNFFLGYAYEKKGEFEKAYNYFNKTLKLSPQHQNALKHKLNLLKIIYKKINLNYHK